MTSRRDVLKTLAALAAAGVAPRALRAMSPRAGTIDRIGLQLYTVRAAMAADLPGTLKAVAALGYREVEFAGYFGRPGAELRQMLADLALTAPSTHIGLPDAQERFGATAEAAQAIGIQYLTVPSLDMRALKTVDDWKRMADTFNTVGARAKAAGLRFGFHNHAAEFTPVEGQVPLDLLIRGTDPTLVTFELDIYWAVRAGQDPTGYLAKHPGRFEMVHVKDATAAPALTMTEVGAGTLDWAAIFASRGAAGIRHYFVEHDNPADPMASIRTSVGYLKALRF
ncbi:MAG: sugar phosphate isomerase/epimerase [Gemmatimonadetes bacterium]|nr:sugar phosphate isomerase/epimerase [Gemmatimonadota bacterium]